MQTIIDKFLLGIIASVLGTLLNGCAVGPDFKNPDAPTASGYSTGLKYWWSAM